MIHLVLCWHFHQPDYRTESGEYFLPWTYLHALKDYTDMAAHLEANPGMRAVVNFVPTLLEQLDDYAGQFRTGTIRDPLLAALVETDFARLAPEEKRHLATTCFKLNFPTMLDPFPGYRRLHAIWLAASQAAAEGEEGDPGMAYLSDRYLGDLLTWYHLAWTGETLRRDRPWLVDLIRKGANFSLEERQRLFQLIGEVMADLIQRFQILQERDQIELSATPHSHPIAPLLIDFKSAREAKPGLPLPRHKKYPGGRERVMVHLKTGLDTHAAHFGQPPRGIWPAEGGVSEATLGLLSEAGIRWAASGEGVLRHSLHEAGLAQDKHGTWLSRPCRLPGQETACFFRDDHLSDLIGFDYKAWFAEDAVRHFIRTLEDRYRPLANADPVVSVILDGENAWEYYPYNGWYFLSKLYQALSEHPTIRTTTFSEYLDLYPDKVATLPRLTAGSWVYGDFTTWVGDAAKNRAWELLCAAKEAFDKRMASGKLSETGRAEAETQLRSCESSDWFWWFGDYNPQASVAAFDRLYREKLKGLYRLLDLPVPATLLVSLCQGGGHAESGGVMRRGGV